MTRSLRILIVDDDHDNADSLCELFEMEGHGVSVAYSGEQAIAAYAAGDFDLAFMDVMMPGLNGVESFLEIRKLRPHAKVFMMTGYSVEQLLHQAMNHGAMGVLTKPIDVQKLLKAMDEVAPSGIVVVSEDTPQFGRHIKDIMARAGITCDLLVNESDNAGDSAVTIIDLGTPLIHGVEVYTRLRRSGRIRPAIIVTRQGPEGGDVFAALRDIAVTGILNKPFDPVALIDRLDILAA